MKRLGSGYLLRARYSPKLPFEPCLRFKQARAGRHARTPIASGCTGRIDIRPSKDLTFVRTAANALHGDYQNDAKPSGSALRGQYRVKSRKINRVL